MTVLEITSYGCSTLRRLRRETRIIDPTAIPRLVPAYEVDRFAATPTLVAADLPAVTLDDLVSLSPLPAAAALHALADVALTLEALHDSGLAHGEVRPATVLVLPDGRAALARPGASATGRDGGPPDRLDDAHDFAVLAFELLTGFHPFEPRDAAAMASSLPMLPLAAANVLELALTIDAVRRPLPHALMVALDAIPVEQWPTNRLHRTGPEAATTGPVPSPPPEPARLAPPLETPVPSAPAASTRSAEVPAVVGPPVKRRSVRRVLGPFVVFLGLSTVFAGGGAGAWLLFVPNPSAGETAAGPPHVRRISLSVTPPQALCPSATLHVTATIIADGGPGELELQWRLPEGSAAEPETFVVDGGRRVLHTAIDLTLSGRRQLVEEVVAVVSPAGARASEPIRYLCSTRGDRPKPPRQAQRA